MLESSFQVIWTHPQSSKPEPPQKSDANPAPGDARVIGLVTSKSQNFQPHWPLLAHLRSGQPGSKIYQMESKRIRKNIYEGNVRAPLRFLFKKRNANGPSTSHSSPPSASATFRPIITGSASTLLASSSISVLSLAEENLVSNSSHYAFQQPSHIGLYIASMWANLIACLCKLYELESGL